MYRSFFNLSQDPFGLTPDPACFVPTERHNEALAALYYGVRQHKGFIAVTGEVGTGKTLVIRCLLKLLEESQDVVYAYVFQGKLTPFEFLQYILADYGLETKGKNKAELLLDLARFLIDRHAKNLTTVLVLDEAQNLSAELLEEVRLLSNLETTKEKLLQIVLAGQPELDDKLDSHGLRQLKQRIVFRTHLEPLTSEQTERYILSRMEIAGSGPSAAQVFSPETIAAVFFFSKGSPRVINTLCENALITAYAQQERSVTPEIIENVARDLRMDLGDPTDEPEKVSRRRR
jgi:general secretion pathway protein A